MRKYNQFDSVILKDGRVAAIVENIVQISNMYLDRCTVQFPQS